MPRKSKARPDQVEYSVWICPACGNKTLARKGFYSSCDFCRKRLALQNNPQVVIHQYPYMPKVTVVSEIMLKSPTALDVLRLQTFYSAKWHDKGDDYWYFRLLEEVGELGATLAGDHIGPASLELEQIASICLNWLELWESKKEEDGNYLLPG